MKYNHAMAEREYKREWKAAKLEMRKAGMQKKANQGEQPESISAGIQW